MNWYYAKNGVQHGPVPLETLRDKIAMGEIGPSDLAWKEGLADWAPVSTIEELKPRTVAEPEVVAVSADPAPAEIRTSQPSVSAPASPGPVGHPVPTAPVSATLAVISMICGIISLIVCCFWPLSMPLALVAIILGHVAISQIKADPSRFGGRGKAGAGLVTGYLGLIAAVIGFSFGLMVASDPDRMFDMFERLVPEENRPEFRRQLEEAWKNQER